MDDFTTGSQAMNNLEFLFPASHVDDLTAVSRTGGEGMPAIDALSVVKLCTFVSLVLFMDNMVHGTLRFLLMSLGRSMLHVADFVSPSNLVRLVAFEGSLGAVDVGLPLSVVLLLVVLNDTTADR